MQPIKRALERMDIFAWRTPPRGAHLFADLKKSLPRLNVATIFDVGANVGQSVEKYLQAFPAAAIHSFEPIPATFAVLSKRFGTHPNVRLHQVALGSESGTARMSVEGTSDVFRISDGGTEEVPVSTIDLFDIERISFMKVDAEGYDLEVMKGAVGKLRGQQIDVVQVEVGMHPQNDLHVRFEDMKGFMEQNGMKLFSIFEQSPFYAPPSPSMYRADAVFISNAMVSLHQNQPR